MLTKKYTTYFSPENFHVVLSEQQRKGKIINNV